MSGECAVKHRPIWNAQIVVVHDEENSLEVAHDEEREQQVVDNEETSSRL